MKCKDITQLMTDKLAGEISPEQDKLLQEHLASCRECRFEFTEMEKFWNQLSTAVKTPSEHLSEASKTKILAQIDSTPETRSGTINMFWLKLAAGVIIISGLVVILLPEFNSAKPRGNVQKVTTLRSKNDNPADYGGEKGVAVKRTAKPVPLVKESGAAPPAPAALAPQAEKSPGKMRLEETAAKDEAVTIAASQPIKKEAQKKAVRSMPEANKILYAAKQKSLLQADKKAVGTVRTLYFYKEKFSTEEIKLLLEKDGIKPLEVEIISVNTVKLRLSQADNAKLQKLLEDKTFFLCVDRK